MGVADFDAFVASRYGSLVRAAYVLTGDRATAEDLVQGALLRAYPAWRREVPASPEAYVRTIMVRLAMREWRRTRRRDVLLTDVPEPATLEADVSLGLALQTALGALPRDARAVLVLRYLYGLSEEETAATLGCARGTVKSRASRALTALRKSGLLEGVDTRDE